MQKITPCLWFDTNAEEAARFYTSIFKDSKIISISRYGESGPLPKGTALTVIFQLAGQRYMALNGGPYYKLTPAISLMVECETQAEIDEYWEKLSSDKAEEQCGWLKDKYGLSWQIVPSALGKMMQDKDARRTENVMKALLQMKKLDLNALEQVYQEGA